MADKHRMHGFLFVGMEARLSGQPRPLACRSRKKPRAARTAGSRRASAPGAAAGGARPLLSSRTLPASRCASRMAVGVARAHRGGGSGLTSGVKVLRSLVPAWALRARIQAKIGVTGGGGRYEGPPSLWTDSSPQVSLPGKVRAISGHVRTEPGPER